MKGFTLIEIAIVLGIIGIVSTVGLFSFSSFSQSQVFGTGVSEVMSLLATARSNAQSQVVPSACGSNPLTGYKVVPTISGQTYELDAVCGGTDYRIGNKKNLPGQLSFQNGSASIFFSVATGVVDSPGTIIITGFGKSQTIYVNKIGNVCTTSC